MESVSLSARELDHDPEEMVRDLMTAEVKSPKAFVLQASSTLVPTKCGLGHQSSSSSQCIWVRTTQLVPAKPVWPVHYSSSHETCPGTATAARVGRWYCSHRARKEPFHSELQRWCRTPAELLPNSCLLTLPHSGYIRNALLEFSRQ